MSMAGIWCHAYIAMLSGPRNVLALGIFVPGLRPAIDEQFQEYGVVVVANPPPIADLFNQAGQVRLQIVAPPLLKLDKKIRRVFDGAAPGRVDVRLIRENSRNGGPELRPQGLLVSAHRNVDEFLGDAGKQKIHVGVPGVPRTHRILSETEAIKPGPRRLGLSRDVFEALPDSLKEDLTGTLFLQREALALVVRFGHFRRHMAAREAARVRVLVVELPDSLKEDLTGTLFLQREALALVVRFGHFRRHMAAREAARVRVLVV